MPKLRKKTTARKTAKRTVKKSTAKPKLQLKAIEKNLAATLKKALAVAKSESKKASAQAASAQKKAAAAEKKNNSAVAKHDAIAKKLATKDSKTGRKALASAKKSIAKGASGLKKIQKQHADLHAIAQNAKCHEERLQSLAKTFAQFHSEWKKKEKSPAHQAAAHAVKPKKVVAPVSKKAKTEKKVEVKKVTRAPIAPATTQNSLNNNTSSSNPFEDDNTSF